MGSPAISNNSIKTSPAINKGKETKLMSNAKSNGEKPWYKSRTILTAIVYGIVKVVTAFGIPIPEVIPEAILALVFIFLRLGNGSSIIKKLTG